MKVLLTGALGNVGEFTLHALLAEGHEVVAFELKTKATQRIAAKLDPGVHVHWGNICDPASLTSALKNVDAVIHLAGIVPPNVERNPDLAHKINVGGTINLIAAMQASATAKRLVFASSMGVVGEVQNREPPLRPDTPVSPTDQYGEQKVECEHAVRESGLQWTILRLGAAMPTKITGGHNDPRLPFEISADARVEFIHPADAGTAFARAIACEEIIGRLYYIGGGEHCQMLGRDFINSLMDSIGIGPFPNSAFVRAGYKRFPGDWLDTSESQRLLQYQARNLDHITADLRRNLGMLFPLLRLLRPVVTWFYTRSSPYFKENQGAD